VEQAFKLTQRGGRIVVIGMFLEPVPMELITVNLNELEIIGSAVYTHEDFKRALEWIDANRFDFKKLITHVLPLEKAEEALNLLAKHEEDVIKALLGL
jgi:threonine dehydrogenase-like Zn-dependent dehydrogenase